MKLASASFTLSLWSSVLMLLLAVGVDAETEMWKRKCKYKNWIPGKCDVTGEEDPQTFDCCDNTCSSCGKQNPFVTWENCEYDENTESVLQCGTVKNVGEPYVCDFEACPENSRWHMEGKKYKKWQKWIGKCDECVNTNMPEIFNNYAGNFNCLNKREDNPGFSEKYWKKACKAAEIICGDAIRDRLTCEKAYRKACEEADQCPKKKKKKKSPQQFLGTCDVCVNDIMPEFFNNLAGNDTCLKVVSEMTPGFLEKYWKKACKAAKNRESRRCLATNSDCKQAYLPYCDTAYCEQAYQRACEKTGQCQKGRLVPQEEEEVVEGV